MKRRKRIFFHVHIARAFRKKKLLMCKYLKKSAYAYFIISLVLFRKLKISPSLSQSLSLSHGLFPLSLFAISF